MVSATTLLTAAWAVGALAGFALAARWVAASINPHRMAGRGVLVGLGAFSAVIFAAPMNSSMLFFSGAIGIGFGGGAPQITTICVSLFGLHAVGAVMGAILALIGIVGAGGPVTSGAIFDVTGSYANAFLGGAVIFVISVLSIEPLRRSTSRARVARTDVEPR